jgi:putative addiction module component (TIGR02574 family)
LGRVEEVLIFLRKNYMDGNEISYQFTEEELNMLEERWKEHKKNPEAARTWEEVKENILRSFNAH